LIHSNQETMHRLVEEVINNKCLTVIDDIIHPDYIYRTPDQMLCGRKALKELFTAYHIALPDLHIKIDELICTDNKAVMLFSLSGTHNNELMGIPATGNQVHIHGITYSYFDNGKIIEEWEILDQLSLFQQLEIIKI